MQLQDLLWQWLTLSSSRVERRMRQPKHSTWIGLQPALSHCFIVCWPTGWTSLLMFGRQLIFSRPDGVHHNTWCADLDGGSLVTWPSQLWRSRADRGCDWRLSEPRSNLFIGHEVAPVNAQDLSQASCEECVQLFVSSDISCSHKEPFTFMVLLLLLPLLLLLLLLLLL